MTDTTQAPEQQAAPATQDTTNQATAPAAGSPAAPAAPVGPKKTKFYFKSRKEMQKQADGTEKEVVIPKPEPVELVIPEVTAEDILSILGSGDQKQIDLLLEAANNVVLAQARSLVDDDVEKARTEGIDAAQLTWDFISKIPPATRRGGGISDELWAEFITDYTEVMQHHGKTKDKAETGAKLLAKRFNPVKDNKKIVQALQQNLMLWFTNTSDDSKEKFQQVYETLTSKADTLLAKDEDAVLAAI